MSFQSLSVPSSPAMTRSSRPQPVTPQRFPRQQQQHRHSQSLYKSPTTPSTPYSPLSLRSATSAGSSVLHTPDNSNVYSKRLVLNSCSPLASKSSRSGSVGDRSLADIAQNWRSRAKDSGIHVSSENSYTEGSNFGDDEASERTLSDSPNDSNLISNAEALLPPPFLSNQRRHLIRPRSQTHAAMTQIRTPSSPTMPRSNRTPSSSPISSRRTSSFTHSENLLTTPPPNRLLASQLKLKGSFTDPAQTRRREAFGVVRTPSQNVNVGNATFTYGLNPDTSLELFDIDENEFENDDDSASYLRQDGDLEESFSLDVDSLYGYPSYPIKFSQSQFADPFHAANVGPHGLTRGPPTFQTRPLGTIAENIEYPFQNVPQDNFHAETGEDMFIQGPERNYYPFIPHIAQNAYYTEPAFVPYPAIPFSVASFSPGQVSQQQQPHRVADAAIPRVETPPRREASPMSAPPGDIGNPTECSVCLVKHPRSLAVLLPCRHPLCSACLTSALNIVGEKDMECAICKNAVDDFRLVAMESKSIGGEDASRNCASSNSSKSGSGRTPRNGIPNVDVDGSALSPVDFGLSLDSSSEQGDPFNRASTPKEEQPKLNGLDQSSAVMSAPGRSTEHAVPVDNVVLRIDNVPWDITPPQIRNWLQQPVERVHVLLDAKGKTLSHAYVEVKESSVAGAILRGEAQISATGNGVRFNKKERSSVLGRGRRARGVTVTKSGQEELMVDLFPNWRGTFDGSRPSLAGLDSDHVIDALEGGLMTENELKGLLYLIREPDSHFLKVPSLPFHLLVSTLSKFPADVDSRVFWSASLRDLLFDVTYAAAQILLSRARERTINSCTYSMELVSELVQAAVDCRALTSQQLADLRGFAVQESIPLEDPDDSAPDSLAEHDRSATADSECEPITPGNADVSVPLNENAAKDVPFDALAREFGVEAQLVQALAQRLASFPA